MHGAGIGTGCSWRTSLTSREQVESVTRSGQGHGHDFPDPQLNPQELVTCATCVYFGSPRVLVSCCKTDPRYAVTAEAAGSSPVVPAILLRSLDSPPSLFDQIGASQAAPRCIRQIHSCLVREIGLDGIGVARFPFVQPKFVMF